MKKLLRNLSMLALMIIGGTQMAWAQETTVVYGRALTEDLANGYTAWSANDVANSGTNTNVWIGALTYSETYGLYGGQGHPSRSSTLEFDHSENAIQTFEIVFDNLGNTGHENNYSYLKIGSQIEIRSNQQKQNGTVIINGVDHAISNCNQRNVNRGGDKWHITAVVNTATNTLTSFTLQGEGAKGKNASFELAEATSLGISATHNTVQVGYNRAGGSTIAVALTSIKISEQKQTVQTVPYTINYRYNSETIKTENGTTAVNNVVKATSPITIEGKKYYAADGATTSLTVTNVEANNVLNVELRAAHAYNYTVKNNFEENIATGVSIEDEPVYAAYPKYKNVDGTLHEASQGNAGHYRCSFVPTSDNYVHTITYSAREIKNVVYYSEGEDITGAIATSAGTYMGDRSSNAACGYTTSDVKIMNLLPGNYQVITCVYSNSTGGVTLNFAYGTETFTVTNEGASPNATHTNNITITEATDLVWKAPETPGSNKNGLDYIYIVKLPVTISLPADYIYSTFSSELDLDFTGNADVEAYIAYSADGKNVTLEQVTKVPAETGLVLKKKSGAATTATVPVLEDISSITKNEQDVLKRNRLVAVVGEPYSVEVLLAGGNAYVLESDTKFSKVVEGVTTGELAVGKAFLVYEGGSSKMNILDGEATAIKGVEVKATRTDNAVYNLQGVRVNKPTANGLYIINGKKYLHK